jgi:hypothetical protein
MINDSKKVTNADNTDANENKYFGTYTDFKIPAFPIMDFKELVVPIMNNEYETLPIK